MNVVTLTDFSPIPRYDGDPWTKALIEEGPSETGPWTSLGEQVLSPVDTDPTNPAARSFTLDNATLNEGWYKVTFKDATNAMQQPVAPVHNVPDETAAYLPLVSDVGALLRTRTKDTLGHELGTFTANTRPTYEQAKRLIDQAADEITSDLDTDIPEGAWRYVKNAITIVAAMKIELSFFSDQVNNNRSVYPQLAQSLADVMLKVEKAVIRETEEAERGEFSNAVKPSYSFPEPTGWETRPM